jgi:nucleotide-binding universal stress UspA family protein
MRRALLARIHVATPVIASWPLSPMHGTITEWQQINADHVLEQARKTVEACAAASELPDVRTELLRSGTIPALVEASEHAQMIVVGSRGTGASIGCG